MILLTCHFQTPPDKAPWSHYVPTCDVNTQWGCEFTWHLHDNIYMKLFSTHYTCQDHWTQIHTVCESNIEPLCHHVLRLCFYSGPWVDPTLDHSASASWKTMVTYSNSLLIWELYYKTQYWISFVVNWFQVVQTKCCPHLTLSLFEKGLCWDIWTSMPRIFHISISSWICSGSTIKDIKECQDTGIFWRLFLGFNKSVQVHWILIFT